MGEDDDMVKKAVYLVQNTGMGRERPERTAGSKTRAFIVARVGNGELSKYLHATVCHRGEGRKSK